MSLESEQIEELATAPKKTVTTEGSVEERPVKDIIAADQYLAGKTAGNAVPWGMRVARVKPGGTV